MIVTNWSVWSEITANRTNEDANGHSNEEKIVIYFLLNHFDVRRREWIRTTEYHIFPPPTFSFFYFRFQRRSYTRKKAINCKTRVDINGIVLRAFLSLHLQAAATWEASLLLQWLLSWKKESLQRIFFAFIQPLKVIKPLWR